MKTEPSPITVPAPAGMISRLGSNPLRSTLLLFLLAFPVYFMFLVLHEGGHALYTLAAGGPVSLFYVHPFPLPGYVRPVFDWNNVWFHVAGPASVQLVSLLLFILCWMRSSASRLPLIMLFPWTSIVQGVVMLSVMDDFNNIVQLTGMSPAIFQVSGLILTVTGIFFFISIFPLLGLAPGDVRSLFVIPAAFFLWAVVGWIAGCLFVPGSPADVLYGLGEDILAGAKTSLVLFGSFGVILAVFHVTLHRWIHPHLPGWLKTETARLDWKDLRIPAVLAVVSILLGLLIIA